MDDHRYGGFHCLGRLVWPLTKATKRPPSPRASTSVCGPNSFTIVEAPLLRRTWPPHPSLRVDRCRRLASSPRRCNSPGPRDVKSWDAEGRRNETRFKEARAIEEFQLWISVEGQADAFASCTKKERKRPRASRTGSPNGLEGARKQRAGAASFLGVENPSPSRIQANPRKLLSTFFFYSPPRSPNCRIVSCQTRLITPFSQASSLPLPALLFSVSSVSTASGSMRSASLRSPPLSTS
ncbi:hypothetical protein VTH06DRAFT_4680 [Thermothelomyces fergusii]